MAITGKLLHVDLTNRETRTEEIPEPLLRKYLGGGALAAHILLRDLPPHADPWATGSGPIRMSTSPRTRASLRSGSVRRRAPSATS